MLNDNIRIAMASLKSTRWRSALTLVGIIVGVVSVITIVSLGEGLKQQVKRQVQTFGEGFITIQPGQTVVRDGDGRITKANLLPSLSSSSLNEQDVAQVRQTNGVKLTAPIGLASGIIQTDDQQMPNATIIATGPDLPDVLNHKILFGGFFGNDEDSKNIAIIGKTLAQTLFGENVPIGRSFRLRGQSFLVRGVFEELPPTPLLLTIDLNRAVFMPYGAAKNLLGISPPINQIFVKPKDPKQVDEVVANLTANLLAAHSGQQDFTILKPSEQITAAGDLLGVITEVVTVIAGVSLIMGGIGIMNIMLVAVTERTREIGIRKAIGATNQQILNQFIIEAGLLSLGGALIGVTVAFIVDFCIRLSTSLEPVVPLWIIGISIGVAVAVGVLFGTVPALKAARKDPIEALRYE